MWSVALNFRQAKQTVLCESECDQCELRRGMAIVFTTACVDYTVDDMKVDVVSKISSCQLSE